MRLEPVQLVNNDSDKALQVYLLGSVEFEDALALQRLLAFQTAGNAGSSAFILCEHPPLITVGRQGRREQILITPQDLQTPRWPIRGVNLGHGSLPHLP